MHQQVCCSGNCGLIYFDLNKKMEELGRFLIINFSIFLSFRYIVTYSPPVDPNDPLVGTFFMLLSSF